MFAGDANNQVVTDLEGFSPTEPGEQVSGAAMPATLRGVCACMCVCVCVCVHALNADCGLF